MPRFLQQRQRTDGHESVDSAPTTIDVAEPLRRCGALAACLYGALPPGGRMRRRDYQPRNKETQ